MKIEIKKLAGSQIEIFVEITWEEFLPYVDRAFFLLSEGLALDGFRPGKAPRDLAEKKIGKYKILTQAAELVLKERYEKILKEKNLEVISQPQVEVLKLAEGNPFVFKIKTEILPEIKLRDYREVVAQVVKNRIFVDNKEIEETLLFLQKSRAKFEDLPRGAQRGDFVEIEYQSPQIDNNRVFKDGFLLGKGNFVKGFEENLEGMRVQEEKSFEINFPPDYRRKDLAGKKVGFRVKINKVQRMELPELNDEFAKNLGEFKTLQELRENIKQGIKEEKKMEENIKWREEVLERMAEGTGLEIPESLVIAEQGRIFEDFKTRVEKELKMDFQDYLRQNEKDEIQLKKDFFQIAQKRLKRFLILREIGKREKIEVTDQEIEQAVNRYLTSYPQLTPQDFDKENLRGIIYEEKVMQLLEKARPKGEA